MIVVLVAALIGAVLGPLLHHLAVATGDDRPFTPTTCHRCGATRGLIGACPSCGASPVRVISTAGLTGVVFAAFAAAFGTRWVLIAYLFLAAMTVVLLITDLDHKRIPNRITYPGTPASAVLLTAAAALDGNLAAMPRAALGAAAYAGVLLVVFVAARGGFGFGDVKLAIPLGLFVAFLGWDRLLVAGFSTALIGGLVAAVALVAGRAGIKSEIPYGPPMIFGAWLAIGFGDRLTDWLV